MMTTTRTPEETYRLRSRKPAEHQTRRQQESYRWNGNDIGATNDSKDYKPLIRIIDGLPVEYSCKDDPRQGTRTSFDPADLRVMTIRFDYEMATEPLADFESNRRSLEWSVLWNVARSIGLHNCNIGKQEDAFGDRRLQPPLPSTNENYVVVLSSLESDEPDPDTDFCTYLNPDGEEVCTPLKGLMTAEYVGDKEIVERYLLTHIAKEMNSRRVRIEQVEQVRYIGDRENLQLLAEARTDLDSKNSGTNIGLVIGVLVGLAVLAFALFLAKGKSRGKRRRQAHLEDDGAISTSIQTVTVAKSDQAVAADDVAKAGSDGAKESLPYNEESNEVDKQQVGIKTTILASSFELPQGQKKDDEPEAKVEESKQSHSVPPRPPLSVVPVEESTAVNKAEKSKTLTTRRKRKKKKKQKVLKRVSSKNSINEMETIREDEDDFELEGSEYSTDDEDDVGMNLNIAASEDDSTDNVTSTSDAEQASPKVSPGNVAPPSPIQEEPKIKRLPPPWI